MAPVDLADPALGVAGRRLDTVALQRDLVAGVDGEIRFDAASRAAYSTDSSNYRQLPLGVVVPRDVEAAVAALVICWRHAAPVVSRGGVPAWPGSAPTPRW